MYGFGAIGFEKQGVASTRKRIFREEKIVRLDDRTRFRGLSFRRLLRENEEVQIHGDEAEDEELVITRFLSLCIVFLA